LTENLLLDTIFFMYENLYENITKSLVNDGFAVIENALNAALCHELRSLAQGVAFRRAGVSSAARVDTKRRSDTIAWIDADTEPTKAYLEFAQGLQRYLNRNLYLGLTYYEAHFACYEKGAFYEKHLDAFKNSKNRVVTTVYYLNEGYKEEDGGTLVIYDKSEKEICRVTPAANTLVVFMSEEFPHEVLPANAARYSIAGWFRVDKRD